MATPSPTVYVPDIYSTDSAGNFIGKPLIDRLHDYPHYGEDDFERNAGYQKSIAGFFASIVIVGLFCVCWMWGINLCACCKCCRDCLPCCFNIFAHKVQRGKCTVIFFFVIAALLATCSYPGRNEFNSAIFDAGDEIRLLGGTFHDLEDQSDEMTEQANALTTAAGSAECSDSSTSSALVDAAASFETATEEIAKLLDGQGEDLKDAADWLEETLPTYVDYGLFAITALIWFNVLFGMVAILTDKCKCDDCCLILIGSITLLALCVLVGLELTLSVTVADFCYKTPEESIMLGTSQEMITYYLTCNGTSPLSSPFDSAKDAVDSLRESVRTVKAEPSISCDDSQLNVIMTTNNATLVTLDEMEGASGCSSFNPRFQGIFHGIICDEVVRGIFFCFLAHCAAAIILLITFCIFPCAANTKPRIEDATSLFKKKEQTKEEEDEEANEIEMAPAIESPKTKTKRKGPKTKPTSRGNSKASAIDGSI